MVSADEFLLGEEFDSDDEEGRKEFIERLNELGEDVVVRTLLSIALFGYNLQCMAVSGLFGVGLNDAEAHALMSMMAAKAANAPEPVENMLSAVEDHIIPYLQHMKGHGSGQEQTGEAEEGGTKPKERN